MSTCESKWGLWELEGHQPEGVRKLEGIYEVVPG